MRSLGLVLMLAMGGAVTLLAASFGLCLLRPHGCIADPSGRAFTTDAREAVMEFVQNEWRCPISEGELVRGHYLRASRADRWGNHLFYTCTAGLEGVEFTVRSAGPDRVFWSADDVVAQGQYTP